MPLEKKITQSTPEKSRPYSERIKTRPCISFSTKLFFSNNMSEKKNLPLILPRDSRITERIIPKHHLSNAHSGPELSLRNVRLHFWVKGGRIEIRNVERLWGHNL